MRKASFYTLGCRVNQTETALLVNSFRDRGYEIVEDAADVCVINSCTVTEFADSKCRHLVRKILRQNPNACIAVVGCYSEVGWKKLQQIKGISLIVGTQDKLRLVDMIPPAKATSPKVVRSRIEKGPFTLETFTPQRLTTRANLKIQDGCNFLCSYCVVPFARGRGRSRSLDDIYREAMELVAAGYRELVLTGINIGAYRFEERSFLDVVERLLNLDGLVRLRISSLEPTTIPLKLFDLMAGSEKMCSHLHVPLQSGSDRILKLMKRRYASQELRDFLGLAASKVEDILLATDIIVGFPGEDEEAFEASRRFLEDSPLAYAHVFTYSKREGTAAARLPDAVALEVKKERSRQLQKISRDKKEKFYQRFIGKRLRVLVEERDEQGQWMGFSDNYIKVALKGPFSQNQLVRVKISDVRKGVAIGVEPET